MCNDRAAKGECYKHPEDMLLDCPNACLNPCLCNVSSKTSDTACDCLVKARDGYCDSPQSQTDCPTTCAKVNSVSCGSLPAPSDPNAHLSTNSTKFMTLVTEVCNVGYRPVRERNQGMKFCLLNGKWDPSFLNGNPVVCQLVDCKDPPPIQNGSLSYSSTIGGSEAKYTCDMGYMGRNHANQTTLICADNETWSGSWLKCEWIDCGVPPTPVGSNVTYLRTDYGANASYGCQSGYTYKHGDLVLTCGPSGSWQDTPIVCEFIDCGFPPPLPHTTVMSNETTFGQMANYTCELGHLVSGGDLVLTCDSSGTWSGSPLVCTAIDCHSPPAATNAVLAVTNTTYGCSASYTCVTGYQSSVDQVSLLCAADGHWTGSPIACSRKDCGPPPMSNGTKVVYRSTLYESMSVYFCETGFEQVTGDDVCTCDSDGRWTGTPLTCAAVMCGAAPVYPGATKVSPQGQHQLKYKDQVHYECLYQLPGTQGLRWTLECGAQKQWIGAEPQCAGTSSLPPSQFNPSSAESKFGWFLGAGILAVIVSFIALLLVLTVLGKKTFICRKRLRKTDQKRTEIKPNNSDHHCSQTNKISLSSINANKPATSFPLPYIDI
ncbi:hypothetical protein Btru_015790 [Bulinus truncatus]|nr:hypothetical protein Btru_015790 [Bulinus truncatus]